MEAKIFGILYIKFDLFREFEFYSLLTPTLVFPRQEVDARSQSNRGEWLPVDKGNQLWGGTILRPESPHPNGQVTYLAKRLMWIRPCSDIIQAVSSNVKPTLIEYDMKRSVL